MNYVKMVENYTVVYKVVYLKVIDFSCIKYGEKRKVKLFKQI